MALENIILALIGVLLVFVFGMLNYKINRAVSKDQFEENKENTKDRLSLGVDRFNRIEDKADRNTNRITIIETQLGERIKKE
uniref:Uncharacterized protein n=1 Tax=viral metagenome TaxID=1070528 RepID=A0A6M3M3X0_9ZZZZ